MALPLHAPLGFEEAGHGGSDDWVSLILSDAGQEAEADINLNPLPLASLDILALPDLDDTDFYHLDEPASHNCFDHGVTSSFQEEQPSSGSALHSDGLFDASKLLELCPSFHHFAVQQPTSSGEATSISMPRCAPEAENGILKCSQSPESAVTNDSSDFPNSDMNMEEDDDFYFLVSDICSQEAASTGLEPVKLGNALNPTNHGSGQGKFETSQSSSRKEEAFCGSHNATSSSSIGKSSRKRKNVDRMSRSSTPEQVAVGNSEKLEISSKEGEIRDEEEEERRQARLIRNRESAQLSRQRKKIYVDELEEKIKTMASTIAELNNTISLISSENINLRRQLGLFGSPPGQPAGMSSMPPWMGAYPPGPMVGGRFMAPGSQVPLVPIPRWKSQQTPSVKKPKKSKADSVEKGVVEKPSKRTKKVAGIAVVGLFFFMFILLPSNFQFLGVKPIFHRETRVWSASPLRMESSSMVMRAGGRVLTGFDEASGQNEGDGGTNTGFATHVKRTNDYWEDGEASRKSSPCDAADMGSTERRSGFESNGSVPLAATLFVPRNEKLVRIEGNLIIHSVLAGDKAAESYNRTMREATKAQVPYNKELSLDANLKAVALKAAPEEKGALVDLQRALAAERSRFDFDGGDIRSVQEDGSLQQWFLEDFTGPVFSSGMCTEVLQFETSPASPSRSHRPASHVRDTTELVENRTAWLQDKAPRKTGRPVSRPSRKSPSYAVPLPPIGHNMMFNGSGSSNDGNGFEAGREFGRQKRANSSVVVSVLAGPELSDQNKLSGGKGLPRIFVVVLIDSVKYVTYSCVLPSSVAQSRFEKVVMV